jgi:acyl dehydratase
MPSWDDVEVGHALPDQTIRLGRDTLVRYAGASGDFNPLHWNERLAQAAGLPNVIAHGMLTMATAGRAVTDWVGDPGAVLEYGVRFSKPVVVADTDEGVELRIAGVVEEKLDQRRVAVGLTVTADGTEVVTGVRAVVQLA